MYEDQEDWDEERPGLPRKIPLKRELAAITAEIMGQLREELLENPRWVELSASERRREARFGDLDAVALANLRARKLLVKCHRVKWRCQKVSPCYEAIARLPLGQFACRVLSILKDDVSLKDALELALTRFEAMEFGRLEAASGTGSFKDGLVRYQKYREARNERIQWMANAPKWKWQLDKNGNMPFDQGLQALIRIDYDRGQRAQNYRENRFSRFLYDVMADEHPDWKDWDDERRKAEVAARLDSMRTSGIEPVLYRHAIIWFAPWYDAQKKSQKRSAGQKGLDSQKAQRAKDQK
jgi:hypothetical protein